MVIKSLLPDRPSCVQKGKKSATVDSFATSSRNVYSRPSLLFLEALLLGKAAQTPIFSRKSSSSLSLEKGVAPGWISFCKFQNNSVRVILVLNCSLFCELSKERFTFSIHLEDTSSNIKVTRKLCSPTPQWIVINYWMCGLSTLSCDRSGR